MITLAYKRGLNHCSMEALERKNQKKLLPPYLDTLAQSHLAECQEDYLTQCVRMTKRSNAATHKPT